MTISFHLVTTSFGLVTITFQTVTISSETVTTSFKTVTISFHLVTTTLQTVTTSFQTVTTILTDGHQIGVKLLVFFGGGHYNIATSKPSKVNTAATKPVVLLIGKTYSAHPFST